MAELIVVWIVFFLCVYGLTVLAKRAYKQDETDQCKQISRWEQYAKILINYLMFMALTSTIFS